MFIFQAFYVEKGIFFVNALQMLSVLEEKSSVIVPMSEWEMKPSSIVWKLYGGMSRYDKCDTALFSDAIILIWQVSQSFILET